MLETIDSKQGYGPRSGFLQGTTKGNGPKEFKEWITRGPGDPESLRLRAVQVERSRSVHVAALPYRACSRQGGKTTCVRPEVYGRSRMVVQNCVRRHLGGLVMFVPSGRPGRALFGYNVCRCVCLASCAFACQHRLTTSSLMMR